MVTCKRVAGINFVLVFIFLIALIGSVSALDMGMVGFDEIRYDNETLWLWHDDVEFHANRMGENILKSTSLTIEIDDEEYYGTIGTGNIEEREECVEYGGGFVPTCSEYQTNVYFTSNVLLHGQDSGKTINGVFSGELIDLEFDSEYGSYTLYTCEGFCHADFYYEFAEESENDHEERISTLESWRGLMEEWRDALFSSLSDLIDRVDALTERVEQNEEDIAELKENSGSATTIEINGTHPYFKYLSSSYRKKMVCGFAEENRLEHLEDLGWSCDLTYKTYSGGRERVRCSCDRID